MTHEQHIKLLADQAQDDFGASRALAAAGYYGHALFWAHLVLEKLGKALWVHRNKNADYPYIHNLLRLLKESDAELSKKQIEFYAAMNQFHVEGRYAEELKKIEDSVNKEVCFEYLQKVKSEMQWLLNQM